MSNVVDLEKYRRFLEENTLPAEDRGKHPDDLMCLGDVDRNVIVCFSCRDFGFVLSPAGYIICANCERVVSNWRVTKRRD